MGVSFVASQEAVAWTLTCPFDDRSWATHKEAMAALTDHAHDGQNPGPCQAFLDWSAGFGNDWAARMLAVDEYYGAHGVYLDYCETGAFTEAQYAEDIDDVHLHNANARLVLDALGYLREEDGYEVLWGHDAAEDFLGRLLLAEALDCGDPGVPMMEYHGERGAKVIDMGRREGTRQELFERLRPLVLWAQERQLDIVWN